MKLTRAEEAALKVYPNEHFVDHTYAEMCRGFYEEGYEQAEKDMKERFIQFVHSHYPINYTGWIQDFQKAMEEKR